MHDFEVVKSFQSTNTLYEDSPDVVFFYQLFWFLVRFDELIDISTSCILHHNAVNRNEMKSKFLPKHATWFINESFFICNYIRMGKRGKYSNFIQSILFFFESQIIYVYFLHCVIHSILFPLHFVDGRICARA
jgi:hypothetical protein